MAASWRELAGASPELAAAGRRLFYQGADVANGYLATVAPDAGPRVHPVCPVIHDDELWLFIVNLSPKYRDLVRNGRFALHSRPVVDGGNEEFCVRGAAAEVADPRAKKALVEALDGRQGAHDFEALFRCELTSVLYTKWDNWGTDQAWPQFEKWLAP